MKQTKLKKKTTEETLVTQTAEGNEKQFESARVRVIGVQGEI